MKNSKRSSVRHADMRRKAVTGNFIHQKAGFDMDLFEYMREQQKETEAPLASRLRPTTLDEMVGQQHIIGKDKLLYRAIKADKLSSIILYGPPGTGKTTLAKVIAHTTSAEFYRSMRLLPARRTWRK